MAIDYILYDNISGVSPCGLRRHTFQNGWTAAIDGIDEVGGRKWFCLAVHPASDRETPTAVENSLMAVNIWLRSVAELDRAAEAEAFADERPQR